MTPNMFVTLFLLVCCFIKTFGEECSCGVQSGSQRIIGGTEVREGKYPWMVHLRFKKPGKHAYCGGAVINDRYILTAAHCTKKATKAEVSYGLHVKATETILHDVEKIIPHEKFDKLNKHNDIALLRVKTPLKFSNKVQSLCLPTADMDQSGNLTVAGWGHTEDGHGSKKLLETSFTETDWETCNRKNYKELIDSQFCAAAIGYDSCTGDSGGPLTKVVNGKIHVVGIVSYGATDCGSNEYSVYTKVSSFLDWIQQNTDDANYCS